MPDRERWEEIAEDLGTYDHENTSFGHDPCWEMVPSVRFGKAPGIYVPGSYVETEPACKRIAEAEAELAVMAQDRDEWRADAERNRAAYAEAMIRESRAVDRFADLEEYLRQIINVLGPSPGCGACEGCDHEMGEALRLAREALEGSDV